MRRSVSSPDETLRRRRKYDTQRSIFDELQVFYLLTKHCIECLIFFLKQNEEEEGGEIKEAKMSSFLSHFQTLIKHSFLWYFLYELLMSLRMLGRALLAG